MNDTLILINQSIHSIREQQGYPQLKIDSSSNLVKDLGLTSLDIAQLIAMLEGETGIDPFASGATLDQVSTVADIASLYSGKRG